MAGEAVERLPDLQAAVRALSGVAWASVVWPDPHGPATLHVAFEGGADAERVARSVLTAMAEVAEVGDAGLEITRVAGAPSGPSPAPRPVLSAVTTSSGAAPVVKVTLEQDERLSTGSADMRGVAPARAAAIAALQAVQGLLGRHLAVALDWVQVVPAPAPGYPEVVHVAVALRTPAGPERHLGAAVVRATPAEAGARAVLDALTRRLQRSQPEPGGAAEPS